VVRRPTVRLSASGHITAAAHAPLSRYPVFERRQRRMALTHCRTRHCHRRWRHFLAAVTVVRTHPLDELLLTVNAVAAGRRSLRRLRRITIEVGVCRHQNRLGAGGIDEVGAGRRTRHRDIALGPTAAVQRATAAAPLPVRRGRRRETALQAGAAVPVRRRPHVRQHFPAGAGRRRRRRQCGVWREQVVVMVLRQWWRQWRWWQRRQRRRRFAADGLGDARHRGDRGGVSQQLLGGGGGVEGGVFELVVGVVLLQLLLAGVVLLLLLLCALCAHHLDSAQGVHGVDAFLGAAPGLGQEPGIRETAYPSWYFFQC